MKFMKEQDYEILQLESGELVLKKLKDCRGEIMLYDGSFRIGLNPELWDKMKELTWNYINEQMKEEQKGTTDTEECD